VLVEFGNRIAKRKGERPRGVGAEALAAAKLGGPSLLVLAVGSPRLNGSKLNECVCVCVSSYFRFDLASSFQLHDTNVFIPRVYDIN
jgi:hypothetical protein